jgi:tRNA(fMet)-specific endonuclease VapC
LAKDPDARLCISVITKAELRCGMAKHPVSTARRQAIEGLLANLEILPWGTEEAAVYGRIRVAIEAQGLSVAAMDMLIASHAIGIGTVLVAVDHIFSQDVALHLNPRQLYA